MGGVDTSVGGALVSKPCQVEQIYGGAGRSISQILLRHHAPNFAWRFLRHIGTFVHHLGGVDTIEVESRGRALAPKYQAKFSKYIGEQGGQYLSFYKGPMHQIF